MIALREIGREAGRTVMQIPMNVSNYLLEHPMVYKACMVGNHFFIRMAPCAAHIAFLPYSFPANCAITLAMSTFYWLTVEQNSCAFSFVFPALIGAVTLHIADGALGEIISGIAFETFERFIVSTLFVSPFLLYTLGVVVLSHVQVENRLKRVQDENGRRNNQTGCCQT